MRVVAVVLLFVLCGSCSKSNDTTDAEAKQKAVEAKKIEQEKQAEIAKKAKESEKRLAGLRYFKQQAAVQVDFDVDSDSKYLIALTNAKDVYEIRKLKLAHEQAKASPVPLRFDGGLAPIPLAVGSAGRGTLHI